jgi:hypothetical protein
MDRADQSYGQPANQEWNNAGAIYPRRESLRRRSNRRAGMGNPFCGHAAVPDREKAGGASDFIPHVVLEAWDQSPIGNEA